MNHFDIFLASYAGTFAGYVTGQIVFFGVIYLVAKHYI
jgi:hypothetical protein